MVDSQFNIIANLEFKSNLASIKESTDRINLLSKQISNLSKEIATVRTGPLTEINNKIRDQLHAINPLNNALAIYNKLSYRQGKGEDLSQRETKSLEDAKSSLKELTGMTQHVDALRKSREDVFFGKQQLTAFRQTKSEIIAGLQELLNKKGKLTAERGELKLRVDMAKPGAMGEIDTKNLEIAQDLMKRTGLEANALTIGLKRLGMTIKGGKLIGPFNTELKVTEVNLRKLRAASSQFKMGLLSVMFAGMALQRVTNQAFRSIITTYQKANEDTQGLGKATWHLQAAWEFFKYSLIEALTNSELFKNFIEFLLKIVNWLNRLSDEDKTLIGISLGILAISGAALTAIGQIGLFSQGLASLGLDIDSLKTSMSGLSKIMGVLAIGFGVKLMFEGIQEGSWSIKDLVGPLMTAWGLKQVGLFAGTSTIALFGWILALHLAVKFIMNPQEFARSTGEWAGKTLGSINRAIEWIVQAAMNVWEAAWGRMSWKDAFDFKGVGKEFKEGFESEFYQLGYGYMDSKKWDTTPMTSANLELSNSLFNTKNAFSPILESYVRQQEESRKLSESILTTKDSMGQCMSVAPGFEGSINSTTNAMLGFSDANNRVVNGNSPSGLIHIIASEKEIMGLQPVFNSSVGSMTGMMDAMSVSISNQQSRFTSLILEIDRYIRKLEEAARAESKSKSGGITGIIKSVLGSRATGGPINKTGPYLLHEGEYVINRHDMKTADGESKTITNNISLSVQTASSDPEEISRIIMDKINDTYSQLNDSTS
jgi:hypothetical protein